MWLGDSVGKNGCVGLTEWIYAETDTSFEVSGAPLATAAKETESLCESAGTGTGASAVASVLMTCS